jgi:glycosyltransferase involved in cell wall biosynthesis
MSTMVDHPSKGTGRELWLFTIRFPFGNGESFLESELPILARGFQKVRLFPLMPEGPKRVLPKNVEVVQLLGDDAYAAVNPFQVLIDLRRWNHVLRVCKASAPGPEAWSSRRRNLMSRLRQAMYRERKLTARFAHLYDPQRVVLYSYWTSDWATVLGLWKLAAPEVRFITRMMGFDMFDHRAQFNWQMLQAFHVAQVEHVLTIAKAGLDHMQQRYPTAKEKFHLSHLATMDHGIGPWAPSETLRIVSCANLVPLKRVHLLVEALAQLRMPVKWTHFGDGEEREHIEAMVRTLPPIIEVELMGNRPNVEVIAWYRSHAADVFVHTSETEGGAPVALQEAASFGIPLIGADAGGVNEIVTPVTGVLLPHALAAVDLAACLRGFRNSGWYSADARVGVRGFWSAHFNAETVHGRLLENLLNS